MEVHATFSEDPVIPCRVPPRLIFCNRLLRMPGCNASCTSCAFGCHCCRRRRNRCKSTSGCNGTSSSTWPPNRSLGVFEDKAKIFIAPVVSTSWSHLPCDAARVTIYF
jgi:hypothetical protein